MVVTGDRDAFQIIDPDSRVRVMATGRGITDTKVYDHAGGHRPLRDHAGPDPRLLRAQGRHVGQHPGRPGHRRQDGVAAAAAVRVARGRPRPHRRHLGRQAQAEPDRALRRRAGQQGARDDQARRPRRGRPDRRGRAAARPLEAARGLPRVRAAHAAASASRRRSATTTPPRPRRWPSRRSPRACARGRSPTWPRSGSTPRSPSPCARRRRPRASCSPRPRRGGSRSRPATACWSARATGPRRSSPRSATAQVIAHDAKALRLVPRNLVHDTLLAAYLLEPARRGFPFREICEERGLACDVADPVGAEAVLTEALAAWQREQLDDRGLTRLMTEIELPLVRVLRDMEIAGVRLEQGAPRGGRRARARGDRQPRARDLDARGRGVRDRLAAAARRGPLREARPVEASAAARPASRPTPASCRRSAPSTRSSRRSSAGASSTRSRRPTSTCCPQLADAASRIHTTFVQAAATTGRLASTNPNMQNVPVRTELGREIRDCFEAAPEHVLLSADYSQVELRVLAFIADEPVLKEIFVRGEDVHTATAAQVFAKDPTRADADGPLEVEDDQLRDRLRAERLRPRRPPQHPARGGEGVHRRLPRALPAGRGVHGEHDRGGDRARAT